MRIGNADTQPERVAKAKGRWRPVLVREIHLARLTIAAAQRGLTPEDLADWALSHGLAVLARQDAIVRPEPPAIPQPPTGKLQPFVRSAPEASRSSSMAGRPSSRRDPNAAAPQDGSKAAKPGPERPAATRSEASMARTREDQPFDAAEDCGPPEDRWGPPVGEPTPSRERGPGAGVSR